MKLFAKSVLFVAFIVITTQDFTGRKGCDCTKCKGNNRIEGSMRIEPVLGKKLQDNDKSSCRICEERKELLRMEKARQEQLQKCPFDILGSTSIKEKTSDEIFDDFRDLIVPSQNGFFDLMRGIVKKIHISSETELKWAKEKEAKELEQRQEDVKQPREKEAKSETIVRLTLDNKPCRELTTEKGEVTSQKMLFSTRFTKETNSNKFVTDKLREIVTTEKVLSIAMD